MKTYTLTHDGFHGYTTISIRPLRIVPAPEGGDMGEVSARTAARLNRAACPSADCTCGETIAPDVFCDGHHYVFLPESGEIRGRYPQD